MKEQRSSKSFLIGLVLAISPLSVQAWEYTLPEIIIEQPIYTFPSDLTDSNLIDSFDFTSCTSFPRPVVGQTIRLLSKTPGESPITSVREVTAVTDTLLSEHVVTTGNNLYMNVDYKQKFSLSSFGNGTYKKIKNTTEEGYIYISKYRQSINYRQVTEYGDEWVPVKSVCIDQKWDWYTDTSIESFLNNYMQDSKYYMSWPFDKIKEVRVLKTVAAGTFNTFVHETREVFDDHRDFNRQGEHTIRWIDINTGITVLEEKKDFQGKLLNTVELQKIY